MSTETPVDSGSPASEAVVTEAPTDAEATDTSEAVEAAAEAVEPEAPAKADKLAPKFAALSRKERALRQKEQALSAAEERVAQFERVAEAAKQNPMKVLESLGLTYQDLTDYILNGEQAPETDPVSELRQQVEAMRRAEEEKQAQQAQQHYQKAVAQTLGDINELLSTDERFELTHAFNAGQLVFDVMVEHYNSNAGELLPIEDAAHAVETWYEQQALERLSKAKKLRNKFIPAADAEDNASTDPATTSVPTTATQPGTNMKTTNTTTLTNRDSSTQPDRPNPNKRTDDERRAASIRALERLGF